MSTLSSTLQSFRPYVLAAMRVVTGYIFMLHGTTKLLALPASKMSDVPLASLAGVGGILELVGGILIILGLFTRPVAFLLSGEMAVAYFMMHAKAGNTLLPILNGGDAAILYCFVFFYFVFSGAGVFSIDNLIARKK